MAIIINILQKDKEIIDELILGICVIGRSLKCDFHIQDDLISGRHGSFLINDSGHLIYKDHDSSNGSYLNGTSIKQSQIKVNDRLQVGSVFIKIDETRLTPDELKKIGESDFLHDVSDVDDFEELTRVYSRTSINNNLKHRPP